jgi:hypothetical protein
MGEMKFPETKIGDHAASGKPLEMNSQPAPPASSVPPPLKKAPLPPIRKVPPLNPHRDFRRG